MTLCVKGGAWHPDTIARILLSCLLYLCISATAAASTPSGQADSTRSLTSAKHSRRGVSGWGSRHGRASQGVLRLRDINDSRKRSHPDALESLLDGYSQRHKRCLFESSYQGQYVIVSMGDSYSGEKTFPPGTPGWKLPCLQEDWKIRWGNKETHWHVTPRV